MTVTDTPPAPPPSDQDAPADITPLRRTTTLRNGTRVPPHDLAAEASLLGAMLLDAKAIGAAVETQLAPSDFYKPAHALIYDACVGLYRDGQPADPVTVADRLHRDGMLDQVGGTAALIGLMSNTPAISNAGRYAKIVAEFAQLRVLISAAGSIADVAYSMPDDVDHAVATVVSIVRQATTPRVDTAGEYVDLDAFLAVDEPDHAWAVPGLLEQGDRCIVTAVAGTGKSTLLRQFGVMCASGLHPFTTAEIDPLRVLLLDVENSARQTRREIRPLRVAAGQRYQPDMLKLRVYGHAINLGDAATVLELARAVETYEPGLIACGPLYKLIAGNPTEEATAKAVADTFDLLRGICGSALMIEAHSPYAAGGGKKRETRPYGASLWERWPEFGWYFTKEGDVEHWRGQREQRDWPEALQRGNPWPWTIRTPSRVELEAWNGPTRCIDAIVILLDTTGTEMSARAIETGLRATGQSFRSETIREAAERAALQGRIVVRSGPRNSRLYSASDNHQQHEIGPGF